MTARSLGRRRRRWRYLRPGASGRAHPGRSRRARRARHRHRPGRRPRSATSTSISPPVSWTDATRSAVIQTEGQLNEAAEFGRRSSPIATARRCASATSPTSIDGIENNKTFGTWNGQPGVTLADQPPAGRQHDRGRGRHQGSIFPASARNCRRRSRSNDDARSQPVHPRSLFDVQFTLLIAGHPRRRRDLRLPAHGDRDLHSLDRAPDHHRRNLRRHGHVRATAWTISR